MQLAAASRGGRVARSTPREDDALVTGLVLVLIGALLCFAGVASVQLGVLAAGFGLGWFVAQLFDAGTGTALLVAAGAALLCWLVTTVVFRASTFVLGVVVGGLIGSRLYALLSGDDTSVLLALVFVPCVAIVGGLLATRYRERALLWATALAGSSMLLNGLASLEGDDFDALQQPEGAGQVSVAASVWLAVALLGWWTQRRLFPKRLGLRRAEAASS